MDNLIPSTFGNQFSCTYNLGTYDVHCAHAKALGPKNDLNVGRSNLPVGDYTTSIKDPNTGQRHNYGVHWARKSDSGCVTSNLDKKSEHVPMMRASHNTDTGQTICYTGRADTHDRIREQIEFMVHTESQLAAEHDKRQGNPPRREYVDQMRGLKNTNPNDPNEYTLTYSLNSLTKLVKLAQPGGLYERQSMEEEIEALRTVGFIYIQVPGRTIKVKLAPLHFHFNLSAAGENMCKVFNGNFSGNEMEEQINGPSYIKLLALARDEITNNGPNPVIQECIDKITNRQSLTVRDRFIYTDMLQRALGYLSVDHCKSSVDRCGVATALAATNQWASANLPTGTSIEDFIQTPEYKNFFLAQLCRSHQQTLPARFNFDAKDNEDAKLNDNDMLIGKNKLNFKMYGSLLIDSMPTDMVKETTWTKSKALRVTVSVVATIAYVIFYPVIFAFMVTVGHLLLGIVAGVDIIYASFAKAEPKYAKKLSGFHELPYIFKTWNIHKCSSKKIDKHHALMEQYGFIA
jgi:hypothetical protein